MTPLRLVRAPRGVGATASTRELRAYAGPFTDLRVRGSVSAGTLTATSEYRFTPRAIEGRWTVTGRGGVAGVTFPSWGRGAQVVATLRDGRAVAVSRRPLALGGVRSLHVQSARSGYTVVPLGHTDGAAVRLIPSRRRAPRPIPARRSRCCSARLLRRFAARIVVDAPMTGIQRSWARSCPAWSWPATGSSRCWAVAAWASSIAPGTPGSSATWR